MADYYVKQGDTAPAISGTLVYADGGPVDLTGEASVVFVMRRADGARAASVQAASIVDGASGKVSYSWATNDTAEPGEYYAEWRCTLDDGSKISVPNDGSLRIHIEPHV